ncbi:hypothetical protein Ddye_019532 [Dipteronia dyeriana]|uniref:RNase H type-1 domain-containing protein n=1 Tax=Dipteronia dyeriana TaxID=168575 RepID=A0AAD9TYI6_9ROSI|nr:hypothetical protein Ddye_019532 [Dipteronia dyeriana]
MKLRNFKDLFSGVMMQLKRKIHTVDWNTLCNSKKNGGLGIGKMLVKNQSLLAKWVWRFGIDDKALWRRVINARYGILSTDLLWDWKCNNFASTFVKVVASLFDEGSISYRVLNEGLNVVIGNGSKANFQDMSGGDSTRLKVACPRIFALAVRKHGVVQDFGNWGNPGNVGIGGVFRDNSGKVLGLFSDHVGTLDSISIEILAIHRVVTFYAKMTSLVGREIDIISDSKVAAAWLNSKGVGKSHQDHL